MSSPDTKNLSRGFACPYSAGIEFEQVLGKAQALFGEADLEGALDLLTRLEKKYVDASKLFDLLGDVLLRRGNIEEGIRYKTLYEILKGTFKIAAAESDTAAKPVGQRLSAGPSTGRDREASAGFSQPCGLHEEAAGKWGSREDVPASKEDFIPVTLAMGQEFMRQGHFDKAFEIFTLLLQKSPEDESLIQARELARKKHREKRLLSVLQKWLANIEQMKAGRPAAV
jgi:tetratricopeptide (TPR) repeat protein